MERSHLLSLLDELEIQLAQEIAAIEPHLLADWNHRLIASMKAGGEPPADAEWTHRVQATLRRIDAIVAKMLARRSELRRLLETHATGKRAMKGYRPRHF